MKRSGEIILLPFIVTIIKMIVPFSLIITCTCTRSDDSSLYADLESVMAVLAQPPDEAESPAEDLSVKARCLFDVTNYGAVADGKTENSLAFMAAWEDACAYRGQGRSTLVVPKGTFLIGPSLFSGPCYKNRSPLVILSGTLLAPKNLTFFKDDDDWIHFKALQRLTLTGGGIAQYSSSVLDAQGAHAWSFHSTCKDKFCNNLPISLKFSNVSHGNVNNITLLNSKGFHFHIYGCDHVNISGINIRAPWDSPNTDGIHISQSSNIHITASTIGVGDDCISIGPGSVDVSIVDVQCGPGHGISVGSLGKYSNEKDVIGIKVKNCIINGTQNGVRVKTWGGDLESNAIDLKFEDIVMVNVSNPIVIDQQYCPNDSCLSSQKDSSVKLKEIKMKNISGSYNSELAVKLICSNTKPCQNVELSYINLTATQQQEEKEEIDNQIGRFRFKGGFTSLQIINSTFYY